MLGEGGENVQEEGFGFRMALLHEYLKEITVEQMENKKDGRNFEM